MKHLMVLAGLCLSSVQAATLADLALPSLRPLASVPLPDLLSQLTVARDLLSGVPRDSTSPWPCQGEVIRTGELPAGTSGTFAAQWSAIQSQGFVLTKRIDQGGAVYFLAHHPAGMNVIGSYLRATPELPARLVICERAQVWSGKPEVPPPAVAAVIGDFTAHVSQWNLGRMSLRAQDRSGDAVVPLGRGEVSPAGVMNVRLPVRPTLGLLRPARDLLQLLDYDQGCSGRLLTNTLRFVGAADVAAISGFDVLNVPFEKTVSAALLQGAPSQGRLISQRVTGSYEAQLFLVYATSPLQVSGSLLCEDTQQETKVTLALRGGWSPVELLTFADGHTVLRHAVPGAVREWQLQPVLPPVTETEPAQDEQPPLGAPVQQPAPAPATAPVTAPVPQTP